MKARDDLAVERLKELYAYDPDTGIFTRRSARSGQKVGGAAGSLRENGYVRMQVDGITYLAHRLAFLYVHGRWPEGQVDHIDGKRANNRIANLREVDQSTNMQNRRDPQKNSSIGMLGVRKDRRGRPRPYMARITVDGQYKYLGNFETAEQAHAAYMEAKRELHAGFVEYPQQERDK